MNPHPIDGTAVNGGVTLATRDYGGAGPDLLFVPGAGQTLADCDLLAPYLTPHHRVVAMDLRGHGRSGDGPFGWESALDDVDAVIDSLELHDAAVVGHSLGGMIAVLHGARHPNSLGVVNMDGHGSGRPEQYDGVPTEVVIARLAELKVLWEAQVAALGAGAPPLPPEAIELMVGRYQALYGLDEAFARQAVDRAHVAFQDGFRPRTTLDMAREIVQRVEALDLEAAYRACKTPLLVYNAIEASPPTPGAPPWMSEHLAAYRRGLSRQLAELSQEIPNMAWLEIDATHALIYEEPELLASQIASFLARRRTLSSPWD